MFDKLTHIETLHELEFFLIATALSDAYRLLVSAARAGEINDTLISKIEAEAIRTIEEGRKVFAGKLPDYFETAVESALFELRTLFAGNAPEQSGKH